MRYKELLTPGRVLYSVCVLGLMTWAASLRFSLPLAPFADADYYGYLHPAISKLTGGPFTHDISREFLYPLFVFLILRVCGSFHALSIIQHLVGLLTGLGLLVAWQEFLSLLPTSDDNPPPGATRRFLRGVWRQWPGLLMAVIFLGRRDILWTEHMIRPEAVFPFFAVASIGLNLRLIRLCWREGCPRATWIVGAAQLFVSCVLFLLRPSFAFAVVFVNLPLALALWRHRRGPYRPQWLPVGIAAGAAVLLLFWPEHILRRGDPLASRLLPSMRLLVHTNLVLAQIEDDLAPGNTPRYDRAMLQAFHDRLAAAYTDAQRPENNPWANLGFNADYIYLEKDVFGPFFPGPQKHPDEKLEAFCNYYCVRAALHHPWGMAAKMGRQLSAFYRFDLRFPTPGRLGARKVRKLQRYLQSLAARPDKQVPLGDDRFYRLELRSFAYPSFLQEMNSLDLGRRQLAECQREATDPAPASDSPTAEYLHEAIWPLYPLILTAALLSAMLVACVASWRATSGVLAATSVFLYSYNLGNCVTIAIAFQLSAGRYIDNQETFTLFSELAGFFLCVETARLLIKKVSSLRAGAPAPVVV